MIRNNDEYAVWAYCIGWKNWHETRNRFADLTRSHPAYRLGYTTAMRQAV